MSTSSSEAPYICPGFYGQSCNYNAGTSAELMRQHIAINHWNYFPFMCSVCAVRNPNSAYLPTQTAVSDHVDSVHKVATEMVRTPHYSVDLEKALTKTVEFCRVSKTTMPPSEPSKSQVERTSPAKPLTKTLDNIESKVIETVTLDSSDDEDDNFCRKPETKQQTLPKKHIIEKSIKKLKSETEDEGKSEIENHESPVFRSRPTLLTENKSGMGKTSQDATCKRELDRSDPEQSKKADVWSGPTISSVPRPEALAWADADSSSYKTSSEEDPSFLDLDGLSDEESLGAASHVPEPFSHKGPGSSMGHPGLDLQKKDEKLKNISSEQKSVSKKDEAVAPTLTSVHVIQLKDEGSGGKSPSNRDINCKTSGRDPSNERKNIDRRNSNTVETSGISEANVFEKFKIEELAQTKYNDKETLSGAKTCSKVKLKVKRKKEIDSVSSLSGTAESGPSKTQPNNKKPRIDPVLESCIESSLPDAKNIQNISNESELVKTEAKSTRLEELRRKANLIVNPKVSSQNSKKPSPGRRKRWTRNNHKQNRLITDFISPSPSENGKEEASLHQNVNDSGSQDFSGKKDSTDQNKKAFAPSGHHINEALASELEIGPNAVIESSHCSEQIDRESSLSVSSAIQDLKNFSNSDTMLKAIMVEEGLANEVVNDADQNRSIARPNLNATITSDKLVIDEQPASDHEQETPSAKNASEVNALSSLSKNHERDPSQESNQETPKVSVDQEEVSPILKGFGTKPVMSINPMPKPQIVASAIGAEPNTTVPPQEDEKNNEVPKWGERYSKAQNTTSSPPIPEKIRLFRELVQLYKDKTGNDDECRSDFNNSDPPVGKTVPKARCMICLETVTITEVEAHMVAHGEEKSEIYSCLECRTSSEFKEEFSRHQILRNHRKYHKLLQPKYNTEFLWNLCFPQIKPDVLKQVLAEKMRKKLTALNEIRNPTSKCLVNVKSQQPSRDPGSSTFQNDSKSTEENPMERLPSNFTRAPDRRKQNLRGLAEDEAQPMKLPENSPASRPSSNIHQSVNANMTNTTELADPKQGRVAENSVVLSPTTQSTPSSSLVLTPRRIPAPTLVPIHSVDVGVNSPYGQKSLKETNKSYTDASLAQVSSGSKAEDPKPAPTTTRKIGSEYLPINIGHIGAIRDHIQRRRVPEMRPIPNSLQTGLNEITRSYPSFLPQSEEMGFIRHRLAPQRPPSHTEQYHPTSDTVSFRSTGTIITTRPISIARLQTPAGAPRHQVFSQRFHAQRRQGHPMEPNQNNVRPPIRIRLAIPDNRLYPATDHPTLVVRPPTASPLVPGNFLHPLSPQSPRRVRYLVHGGQGYTTGPSRLRDNPVRADQIGGQKGRMEGSPQSPWSSVPNRYSNVQRIAGKAQAFRDCPTITSKSAQNLTVLSRTPSMGEISTGDYVRADTRSRIAEESTALSNAQSIKQEVIDSQAKPTDDNEISSRGSKLETIDKSYEAQTSGLKTPGDLNEVIPQRATNLAEADSTTTDTSGSHPPTVLTLKTEVV